MPNPVIYRIWLNLTLASPVAPVLKKILAQVGLGLRFKVNGTRIEEWYR